MKVKDIISLVKVTSLHNLVIPNEEDLLTMVYLGLSELYLKFDLLIKTVPVKITSLTPVYDLRVNDLNRVIAVYSANGSELTTSSIIGDYNYDYKQITYKTFVFQRPIDSTVYFIYNASPERLESMEDELDMPNAFMAALMDYVAYLGHSRINQDGSVESNLYLQRFIAGCNVLVAKGYKINRATETLAIQNSGLV